MRRRNLSSEYVEVAGCANSMDHISATHEDGEPKIMVAFCPWWRHKLCLIASDFLSKHAGYHGVGTVLRTGVAGVMH
jgi:hypothetical protein